MRIMPNYEPKKVTPAECEAINANAQSLAKERKALEEEEIRLFQKYGVR